MLPVSRRLRKAREDLPDLQQGRGSEDPVVGHVGPAAELNKAHLAADLGRLGGAHRVPLKGLGWPVWKGVRHVADGIQCV